MYCNILVTKPFDHTFTYKIRNDQNVKIGSIVSVSFGKKKDQIGIIYRLCGNEIKKNNSYTIKEIDHVYEGVFLNKNIIIKKQHYCKLYDGDIYIVYLKNNKNVNPDKCS